jgi:hypothetical protein
MRMRGQRVCGHRYEPHLPRLADMIMRNVIGGALIALCAFALGQSNDISNIVDRLDGVKGSVSRIHVFWTETEIRGQAWQEEHPDLKASPIVTQFEYAAIGPDHRLTISNDISQTFFHNLEGDKLLVSGLTAAGSKKVEAVYFAIPIHMQTMLEHGFTVRGEWLADVLRSGKFKITEEPDKKFGPLIHLSGTLSNGIECEISLAQEMNLLAVRHETRSVEGNVQRFAVQEIRTVGGFAFPSKTSMVWSKVAHGVERPYMELHDTVSKVSLDDFDSDYIRFPRLPNGTLVKDDRSKEIYEIGQNGVHITKGRVGTRASEAMATGRMQTGWVFLMGSMFSLIALSYVVPRFINKRRSGNSQA